jgi:hypothetical protein
VVDAAVLDEFKASLATIESVHVYSLAPRGVGALENLHEIDLAQNREALGTSLISDYAALGRVSLGMPLERLTGGAPGRKVEDTPTRSRPATEIAPKGSMGQAKESRLVSDPSKALDQKATESIESKKRRKLTIESDSDEEDAPRKTGAVQINDKGEEVMVFDGDRRTSEMGKKRAPAKDEEEKREKERRTNAAPAKQKGIMGFFKPKSS